MKKRIWTLQTLQALFAFSTLQTLQTLQTLLNFLILTMAFNHDSQASPNILFVMSDDHAAHAIGAYEGRFAPLNPTPNIDHLASEGMLFENAFCSNSICTPSRATLLTGQYSHQNGITTLTGSLESDHQHLPHLMKKAGYETAMIGKWHLKKEPAFDYYCVLPGQGSYFNPIFREKGNGNWPHNVRRFSGYDSRHSSDVITDLSLKWLRERRSGKPFFLMHHFKAPHDNFENAERYDWLYEDDEIPEPESLWKRSHGSIATKGMGTSIGKRNRRRNMGHHMFVDQSLSEKAYKQLSYQRYLKKYLRTVRGIDDNLGRLLDYLKDTDQYENTIIIYTSDQGFMLGEHDYIDKRWMYEESLRIPLIIRYPRVISPKSSTDLLVSNVDFAPTLLQLGGYLNVPNYMKGRSLLPILKGQSTDWRNAIYYRYWMHMAHHDNPAHYGIRTADYKLIFFYGLPLDAPGAIKKATSPGWELYDLREDPKEMSNVYSHPDYREIAKKLKAQLLKLKDELGDRDEKYPELMKVRDRFWD